MAPTTVGIAAAAKAMQDEGLCEDVKVSGLGLPAEMREFTESGCAPEFALWSFVDLGWPARRAGGRRRRRPRRLDAQADDAADDQEDPRRSFSQSDVDAAEHENALSAFEAADAQPTPIASTTRMRRRTSGSASAFRLFAARQTADGDGKCGEDRQHAAGDERPSPTDGEGEARALRGHRAMPREAQSGLLHAERKPRRSGETSRTRYTFDAGCAHAFASRQRPSARRASEGVGTHSDRQLHRAAHRGRPPQGGRGAEALDERSALRGHDHTSGVEDAERDAERGWSKSSSCSICAAMAATRKNGTLAAMVAANEVKILAGRSSSRLHTVSNDLMNRRRPRVGCDVATARPRSSGWTRSTSRASWRPSRPSRSGLPVRSQRSLEAIVAAIVEGSELTSTDDEHDPEGATIAYERTQAIALLRQARTGTRW